MKLISMGYVVLSEEWGDIWSSHLTMEDAREGREKLGTLDESLAIKEIFDGFNIEYIHDAGAYVSP